MAADEPHAYLYGECVECMATSDNVVRAGLTPKYKDVPTLVNMLTYNYGKPKIYCGDHAKVETGIEEWNYIPPIPEFRLKRTVIQPNVTHNVPPAQGPTILIVYDGEGQVMAKKPDVSPIPLTRGSAIFICVNAEISVTAGNSKPLDLYFATTNL